MSKILVLAEKPSVGRDLARVLKCNNNKGSYIEGSKYIVTWAMGHLVGLMDPEGYDNKYKEWKMETLPMLPKHMKLVVLKKTGKQFNEVKKLMNRDDVSEIVSATEAGREGELVARWTIEKAGVKKPLKRLWISSQTDKAILDGFRNLKDGKEYENLMLVDLICHGVPSPKVWQTYIDYRAGKENGGKRPVKINMRSKTSGWSRYSTEFDYGNGRITRIQNSQDPYIRAFIGNICLRDSCSECLVKGVERCTDLTLGDYWGIWNQHPEFNDEKGTSIVFTHSEKGKNALKRLKEQTEWFEIDTEDGYRENVSMVLSSQPHQKRKEFLDRVTSENFGEVVKEYFPPIAAKKPGVWERVKRKLAQIIH